MIRAPKTVKTQETHTNADRCARQSPSELPFPSNGRLLQFGVKYFRLTSAAMVLVLVLSEDIPVVRQWRMLYGYITVVVVLVEKASGEPDRSLYRSLKRYPDVLRLIRTLAIDAYRACGVHNLFPGPALDAGPES